MFACNLFLLVTVVISHKFFAVVKGSGVLQSSQGSNLLLIPLAGSDEDFILSVERNQWLKVTSQSEFTFVSVFDTKIEAKANQKSQEYGLGEFIRESSSPFFGTIVDSETGKVAHIFVLLDGSKFDEDITIYTAEYCASLLNRSAASEGLQLLKTQIDSIYKYPLSDFETIPFELRNLLSSKDRKTLITHLRKYRKARQNENCGTESRITALTVKRDGSFQYAYAFDNLATPLQVSLLEETAIIRKTHGATFPLTLRKSINKPMPLNGCFLAVADHGLGDEAQRTYLLVNAEPTDILKILEVIKLNIKNINDVYKFALRLFKLSTNNNAIKYLNLHRKARNSKHFNELGITAVTVTKGLSVNFGYSVSSYSFYSDAKRTEELCKVTVNEEKEVVITKPHESTAIFPTAMGAFVKNILTITGPESAFIGVVGNQGNPSHITLIFVGMEPMDILKLAEVSKSFATNFSVEALFKIFKQAFGGLERVPVFGSAI